MILNPLKNIVSIDLETTGFSAKSDDVLECAIVDGTGEVLFNSRFKPTKKSSWPRAQEVNKISPEMVKDCYPFENYREQLRGILRGKDVLIYNKDFDSKWLKSELSGANSVFCVMKEFAEYYKFPNPNRNGHNKGRYKYVKLVEAAAYFGYNYEDLAHCAVEDAKACLHVWEALKYHYRMQLCQSTSKEDLDRISDFLILSPMGYFETDRNHMIGMIRRVSLQYARQIIQADYNPSEVLLVRKESGNQLVPFYA